MSSRLETMHMCRSRFPPLFISLAFSTTLLTTFQLRRHSPPWNSMVAYLLAHEKMKSTTFSAVSRDIMSFPMETPAWQYLHLLLHMLVVLIMCSEGAWRRLLLRLA